MTKKFPPAALVVQPTLKGQGKCEHYGNTIYGAPVFPSLSLVQSGAPRPAHSRSPKPSRK